MDWRGRDHVSHGARRTTETTGTDSALTTVVAKSKRPCNGCLSVLIEIKCSSGGSRRGTHIYIHIQGPRETLFPLSSFSFLPFCLNPQELFSRPSRTFRSFQLIIFNISYQHARRLSPHRFARKHGSSLRCCSFSAEL